LAQLVAELPAGLQLRLDANGAWSEAEAQHMLRGLVSMPIECLEEPLRQPSPSRLRWLQEMAPFPLALDESLRPLIQRTDLADLGVDRIIIKLGVCGGLREALGLARRAQSAERQVVVTSSIESAAGLWAAVELAAATGSGLPHGLATAHWLAEDVGAAPRPAAGWIACSDRPGSGFAPSRSDEFERSGSSR
jgi:L-alanine-DL-glutamate epimerase-like enolase superfamily enzyme